MRVIFINQDNIHIFAPLLLPKITTQIQSGFFVTALGLIERETAIGAAAGSVREGDFLISSFYIAKEYRGKGGGRMLLELLREYCKRHAKSIKACFSVSGEEHLGFGAFLETMGFQKINEADKKSFHITLGQIQESEYLKGFKEEKESGKNCVILLKEADIKIRSRLAERVDELADVPVSGDVFLDGSMEEDISILHMKDGIADGFVLFEVEEGGLCIAGAYNGTGNPAAMIHLFKRACAEVSCKYPLDTLVYVDAVTQNAVKLVRAILPEAVEASVRYEYINEYIVQQ